MIQAQSVTTASGRLAKKPTKREWLADWLHGLELGEHTGQVTITLHFNKGGITRLVPMLEVPTHHLGGSMP